MEHINKRCTHRAYGMSCDQFDALRLRAAGSCELCITPTAKLHIDHDHDRGWWAVRGLVCPKCNAHMRRVDSGERPMDGPTERYAANPFWQTHSLQRNTPGPTPINLAMRLPLRLLEPAKAKAASEGTTVTAIVVKALERYVKK